MIYKYKIRNNEFIEITYLNSTSKPLVEMPTGVKAFYTKKEIMERYKWCGNLMRKNLLSIGDKIYDDDGKGGFVTTKRVFLPEEICYIVECFGLP